MSISSLPEPSLTASRRELWIRVALAVARGLPEPCELGFYPDPHTVTLRFDAVSAVRIWAAWLHDGAGCDDLRNLSCYSGTKDEYAWFRGRGQGWLWNVLYVRGATLDGNPAVTERTLAAELTAALGVGTTSPDQPWLAKL